MGSRVRPLSSLHYPPLHLQRSKDLPGALIIVQTGRGSDVGVFMNEDGACWTTLKFEVRMTWDWSFEPECLRSERPLTLWEVRRRRRDQSLP